MFQQQKKLLEHLFLEPFFVSLDEYVLANTIYSLNFTIISSKELRFYFAICAEPLIYFIS